MLSLRLKGKWSFRQRQAFHYDSVCIIYPLPYSCTYFHIFIVKAARFLYFGCLMPKGEKLIGQRKRTAPPPCFLKTFSNLKSFAKTLLTAKGRIFSGVAFNLAKGKAFHKGRESFKT
jgi:hypothetical protein